MRAVAGLFPSPRGAKRSGERVPNRDSGEAGEGQELAELVV
jgi:hypothetical protein